MVQGVRRVCKGTVILPGGLSTIRNRQEEEGAETGRRREQSKGPRGWSLQQGQDGWSGGSRCGEGAADGQGPGPTGSGQAKELGLYSESNEKPRRGLKPMGPDELELEVPQLARGRRPGQAASPSRQLTPAAGQESDGQADGAGALWAEGRACEGSPWLAGCRAGQRGCQDRRQEKPARARPGGPEPEEELRLHLRKVTLDAWAGQTGAGETR